MKYITLLALLISVPAVAVEIRFSDEELTKESVYPIFENPAAVKNRRVVTKGKIEVGAFGGWVLDEILFDPINFSISATYHFNEVHGFQFWGGFFSSSESKHVDSLRSPPVNLRSLEQVPSVKNLALGLYQYTPYYGKISLTKSKVMNISTFATLGGGMVKYGNETSWAASLGIGQKFYFSPRIGLRFDLRTYFYNGVKILSGPVPPRGGRPGLPFQKQLNLNTLVNFGAVFIF